MNDLKKALEEFPELKRFVDQHPEMTVGELREHVGRHLEQLELHRLQKNLELERVERLHTRLDPYWKAQPDITLGEAAKLYLKDHPEMTEAELLEGIPQYLTIPRTQ